jgi:hypothetical protein
MDAGGSCSHARNKIRYFGGLKISAVAASVFGVTDWKIKVFRFCGIMWILTAERVLGFFIS